MENNSFVPGFYPKDSPIELIDGTTVLLANPSYIRIDDHINCKVIDQKTLRAIFSVNTESFGVSTNDYFDSAHIASFNKHDVFSKVNVFNPYKLRIKSTKYIHKINDIVMNEKIPDHNKMTADEYDNQTELLGKAPDPGNYDKGGGAKKVRKGSTPTCTSTGKKVTFTKDGKKVTRVVHENQRGTKVVKYNDAWVLLSKLKI